MSIDRIRLGRKSSSTGSRRLRGPVAAVSAVALMATALTVVAVVEAPSALAAGATVWASRDASSFDCTNTAPCPLDIAVDRVNSTDGGTVELFGNAAEPYVGVSVNFTGVDPVTIEAAPGETPVLIGSGTDPVISNAASLTVSGLDISGGSYGILSSGGTPSATVVQSYVHDNDIDGISELGPITVRNSAIGDNGRMGINAGANTSLQPAVLIVASTVFGNQSGVDAFAPRVISSTIAGNGENLRLAFLTAAGSIIAGGHPNCIGIRSVVDGGGNISDDSTCLLTASSSVQNSASIVASLRTPDFNGGTPTIGLLTGSPAIGLVADTVTFSGAPLCAQPDQRGQPRPSTACDAGAYQSGNPMAVTLTAPSATITLGEGIPDFFPSDPSGTRLRTAAHCETEADGSSAGSYPVTCFGAEASPDVAFTYVDGTLTITKAPMTVTASSPLMSQGGPVSTITPGYSGFVNGEGSSSIDTPPACTTTATATSPPGQYPSSCSGAIDNNYTFTYVDGTVTVVDTTPPVATIDSGPSGPTASTTATFAFSSNEAGSTFNCRMTTPSTTGDLLPCTSPATYSGLVDGTYTFFVLAIDAAHNREQGGATRSFTVDTRAPDTTITSGPSGVTSDTAPVFAFSSTESGSTFECKLDRPGVIGTYGACSSPTGYAALTDGDYVLSVRATDAAGNTDAIPATRSFTVEATPPDTTIDSGPSGPSNTAAATFGFSSTEPGSSFECKLDGPGAAGTFGSCNSPAVYSSLADGSYTFSVRATSGAGTADPTPATRSFTVDTVAPVITSTTPSAGATFAQGAIVNAQYSCADTGGSGIASCIGPVVPGAPIDTTPGAHTFVISATDNAGNRATANITYVVRATQSISWAQQGPYAYGQAPVTLTATATSGLPVSYTVNSGPCSVSGSTLTITGVGACNVSAAQPGNMGYLPAPVVGQMITINRAATLLVVAPAQVRLLRATFSATLTSAVTGRPISGQTIDFSRGGTRLCSGTTNSNGVATCSVNGLFLVIGHMSYTAAYNGNANYLPSSGSTTNPSRMSFRAE